MKLKKEFIARRMNQSSVLVPTGGAGFSGVVKGNATLGNILELMKEDTSRDEVVSSMRAKFSAPEGIIERDVDRLLAELRSIGALDE